MKNKKRLVAVFTRINGVEKLTADSSSFRVRPAGLVVNEEFHKALGLKVYGTATSKVK